jgi:alpha-1,3-rhamnosyl/mannosyltransferase
MAGAEALCYISLYEGFGLPVAEAMACGVPVIVSQGSAHAEVAGDAGYPVDPGDPEEVAASIDRILSDTALRRQCIEHGLRRGVLFSWDNAATKTYEVLSGVIK